MRALRSDPCCDGKLVGASTPVRFSSPHARFKGQAQAKDLVSTVGDFEVMLASWIILGLAAPAAVQVNRSSHFLSKQAVDVSSQGLRCGGLDLPENLGAITI